MAAFHVCGGLGKQSFVGSVFSLRKLSAKCRMSTLPAVRRLPVKDWQMVPSKEEVSYLLRRYEDPEGLVKKLLARRPIAGKQTESLTRRGSLWNFKLTMNFPVLINVGGCGRTPEEAKQSAYLQACALLQELCLMKSSPGDVVNCYEAIMELEYYGGIQKIFSKKDFKFEMVQLNDGEMWSCRLLNNMNKVIGFGLSREEARENAASSMILKLKAKNVVKVVHSGQVAVVSPFRLHLPGQCWHKESPADFTFYVDASKEGFGAYLINKDQSDVVRWISQKWPPRILDHLNSHSSFLEFYALFSVVYTWKKKFRDCSVLAHSDSKNVCHIINQGLDFKPNHRSILFFKPYKTLVETCIEYNISLKAKFVARDFNAEADFLSKQQICNFFYNMEDKLDNPSFISKKAKQLTFLQPFVYERIGQAETVASS